MSDHEIRMRADHTLGARMYCSCGWAGPWRRWLRSWRLDRDRDRHERWHALPRPDRRSAPLEAETGVVRMPVDYDPLDPRGDGTLRPGDPVYDAAIRGESVMGTPAADGTWELRPSPIGDDTSEGTDQAARTDKEA